MNALKKLCSPKGIAILLSGIFSTGIMLLGFTRSGGNDALLCLTFGTILFGIDILFCTMVTSPHSAAAALAFVFINTTGTALQLTNDTSLIKLLVITAAAVIITVVFMKMMPFISRRCNRSAVSFRVTVTLLTALTVALYLMLFLFPKINNARVWLVIGGFTVQASEITKLLFLLTLSLIMCSPYVTAKKQLILSAVILLIHAAFLMIHNELGTLFLLVIIWTISVFVFLPTKLGVFVLFGVTVSFMLGLLLVNSLYATLQGSELDNTIVTIVNKIHDRLFHVETYQSDMALQAIVNGGLTGSPADYRLDVPVGDSDFAFAALLCQNFGVLTAMISVVAAAVPVIALYRFACGGRLNRNYILAFIAGISFTIQFVTVLLTNSGFFPIVGIGLPFISGGTNYVMSFILAAVIVKTMSPEKEQPNPKRLNKKELRKNVRVKPPHKNKDRFCFADWCDDVRYPHNGSQSRPAECNTPELGAGPSYQGAPQ